MVPFSARVLRLVACATSLLAAGAAQAQFANTCESAPTVAAGNRAFDLRTAAINNPAEFSFCSFEEPDYDQWTRFVPTADGIVTIAFQGMIQGGDAWIAVFDSCDGFSTACASTAGCRTIKLSATVGTPILIRVHGVGAGQPFGSIRISATPPLVGGDNCGSAAPTATGTVSYNASGSVDNASPGGCLGFDDVWFVHVPPVTGIVTASLCGQSGAGDTIGLYSSCLPEGALDCGNFNDDDFAYPPCRAKALVQGGAPVYIRVTAFECVRAAQFTLSFSPGGRPANDDCENAIAIGEGDTTMDNTFATTDGVDSCGEFFDGGKDLWFEFTPAVSASFDFSTYDLGGLPVPISGGIALELLTGCGGAPLACDNAGFSGNYFRLALSGGTPYIVRVAGSGRLVDGTPISRGDIRLNVRRVVPPTNDLCVNARAIGAGEFAFDIRDLSADGAPACAGADPVGDLWYLYTPSFTGSAEFGLVAEEGLAIQSAEVTLETDCNGSLPRTVGSEAYDTMTGARFTRLIFQATTGQSVLFRVAASIGFPSPTNGRVYAGAVRSPAPPVNDTCANATLIGPGTRAFSVVNATISPPPCYPSDCDTDACTTAIFEDIFYRFAAGKTGTASMSVDDGEVYPFGGATIAILSQCGTLPIACALECGDAPLDSFSFPVQAGQSYIVRIGAQQGQWISQGGTFTLSIPCRADFNNSGTVTVQDIFDFLAAYFANLAAADYNNSGTVTVQDIFDFLGGYFSGC